MTDLILTIVVGGIIGWLASLAMKTDAQMGKFANVIVGIVGASVGFWGAGLLGVGGGGFVVQMLIAVAGAIVLIWVLKLVGIFK